MIIKNSTQKHRITQIGLFCLVFGLITLRVEMSSFAGGPDGPIQVQDQPGGQAQPSAQAPQQNSASSGKAGDTQKGPNSTDPNATDVSSTTPIEIDIHSTDSEKFFEQAKKLRDPFLRPNTEAKGFAKTGIERFAIDEMELLGVITGPKKIRALVRTPDGKTYFVSERMKLGNRGGIIRRITEDTIWVRERLPNIFGKEEDVDTPVKIAVKVKSKTT